MLLHEQVKSPQIYFLLGKWKEINRQKASDNSNMHGGCGGHFRLFFPCYFYVFFPEEEFYDLKNEPVQGHLLSCLPTSSPCGNGLPSAGHVPQLPLPWSSRARKSPPPHFPTLSSHPCSKRADHHLPPGSSVREHRNFFLELR